MKKKWIVWSIVAAVAVVLGIVFPRYILVGGCCCYGRMGRAYPVH